MNAGDVDVQHKSIMKALLDAAKVHKSMQGRGSVLH
ncbi:hypothetical protein BMW23_0883 [Bodo saltans virus]|uniref:Uncharacterized protein n=1 Tax=Bodo saltans virus TaxID=2024608 RepID=A0A2H4UVH5_9VIRU|nr:hypothetical protein QJ851_gp0865 [Bodo saltans virus]ATZ80928.1 hypothetical protein BMW23_0883 [Bodo saltans virus]